MNSSQHKNEAYRRYEFKKLCHIIGFTQKEVQEQLETINSSYKEWNEVKKDKNGKPKTFTDGKVKTRTIRNPSTFLKQVQRRIKNNILDKIALPINVQGGVRQRSNITNAKFHQGNKYILTTDLQNFFPSISKEKVYQFFVENGYSSHFAHWLTVLTTKSNELPQGSPTSQSLANLVFLKTDQELIDFCKKNEIIYTRYVDDLTFSSPKNFSDKIKDILNIVTNAGFTISYQKTNYAGNQLVTGIHALLNKIDAPLKIKEKSKIELATNSEKKPYTNYVRNIKIASVKKKKRNA